MRSSQALRDLADMDMGSGGEEGHEEEDDDEETLQLQLQAIQAKLKLKKLQSAKKKAGEGRSGEDSASSSLRSARATSPRKLYESALPQSNLQVPVSPVKNLRAPTEQLSPARARLGLTSNPRATDVSLKRARDGNQIKKSSSLSSLRTPREEPPKVSSFSARLAASKQKEEEKQAKLDRLQQMRSSGFNHARSESVASSRNQATPSARRPELDEMVRPSSAGRVFEKRVERKETTISRSTSTCSSREDVDARARAQAALKINPGHEHASGTGHADPNDDNDDSFDVPQTNVDANSGYDPFSKIHLSRRHISHSVVAREMEGKEVYSLPRLLKEIKAPEYEPPDCESDYIVFAVLASKSSPIDHATTHRTNQQAQDNLDAPRNKFMVLHLCDLKWEIDCFLFGTAFNQFWKLTPGTLLAILNPAIMPPKGNQNNGRFSLKLGSSEDAVMEIGLAKDLGYCVSIKKDGQPCGDWVDKRKTEACEFHLNLQIEKNRKGRMEVNTMFTGGNRDDRTKSKVIKGHRENKSGGVHHREFGTLYSVPGRPGKSAASLLDDDDKRMYDDLVDEDTSRKRIAQAQKERDLQRQLNNMGKGSSVGAAYMRASNTVDTSTFAGQPHNAAEQARLELFEKKSASELGLLGNKASMARLSPSKDRKAHFGLGAMAIPASNTTGRSSTTPMGWGGAKTAGLLQPKENKRLGSPERGQQRLGTGPSASAKTCDGAENRPGRSDLVRSRSQQSSIRSSGSQSPTKKKARFDLMEKGIKVPGRESLPGLSERERGPGVRIESDDDDDLDIV